MHLQLTADEVLTTTRAVRRRLDLDRAVPPELIRECLEIAVQGPSGGNTQGWHFVVVHDQDRRAGLAELYRRGWERYRQAPGSVFDLRDRAAPGPDRRQMVRVARSADYLAEHLQRVPVHVIPCIAGRVEKMAGGSAGLASVYGSILPATWSFMLAARNRGLGTCWTTVHLLYEQEAAELLGIPYGEVTQVALIPTAWSIGTGFKPARRRSIEEILHTDHW